MILIYQSSINGPNNVLKNKKKISFNELFCRFIKTWQWKCSHWSLKSSGHHFTINALYELIMAETWYEEGGFGIWELGGGWQPYGYKCSRHYVKNRKDLRSQNTLLLAGQTVLTEKIFFSFVSQARFICTFWFLMEICKLSVLMLTVLALACSVQGLSLTLNRDPWISDNWEVRNVLFKFL